MDPEPVVNSNEKMLDHISIQETQIQIPRGALHTHAAGRIWKPSKIRSGETGLTTSLDHSWRDCKLMSSLRKQLSVLL